jgi:hypothetical protein
VLRKEIDFNTRPPTAPPEENPVGTEPERPNRQTSTENVNETKIDETETNKVEETQKEQESSDEDGLFTSEFDNLMDPDGFGNSMEWINDI